jgi:hypothetical protein
VSFEQKVSLGDQSVDKKVLLGAFGVDDDALSYP